MENELKEFSLQIVTKQSDEEYVRNIIETVSAESALQMEMQTQEKRKAAGGKRKRNSSSNVLNEEAVAATVPVSAVNAEPPPIKKSKEKSMTPNDASGGGPFMHRQCNSSQFRQKFGQSECALQTHNQVPFM